MPTVEDQLETQWLTKLPTRRQESAAVPGTVSAAGARRGHHHQHLPDAEAVHRDADPVHRLDGHRWVPSPSASKQTADYVTE